MRLLFYATNGLGMGHVTRLLTIVRAVRRRDPSHEILFLTRCEAGPYGPEDDVFTLRLPGSSRARSAGLTPKSYYQMVHPLLWQAISSFDPNLLVTDTFPEGPEGELAPVMRWPIRKAFVYRESRSDQNHGTFRKALEPYQLILVAHERKGFSLPPSLAKDARVEFTGIISNGTGPAQPAAGALRKERRRQLGLGEEPTVLVTLGGGGDPEARKLLPPIADALRREGVAFFVASGPLGQGLPHGIGAREWLPLWPLAPWLPAFDMAVAGCGYNTVSELRESGIPSLLIPFSREVDDQEKRGREASGEGWALVVDPKDPDWPGSIHAGIRKLRILMEKSSHKTAAREGTPETGADRAAELLLDLARRNRPTAPAAGPSIPSDRETVRVPSL